MNKPGYPDPERCITHHSFNKYWLCLAPDADVCPYGFGFGREYLCRHHENYLFSDVYKIGDRASDL